MYRFDIRKRGALNTWKAHTSTIYRVEWLNKNEIVSVSGDYHIHVWNMKTGKKLRTVNTSTNIYGMDILGKKLDRDRMKSFHDEELAPIKMSLRIQDKKDRRAFVMETLDNDEYHVKLELGNGKKINYWKCFLLEKDVKTLQQIRQVKRKKGIVTSEEILPLPELKGIEVEEKNLLNLIMAEVSVLKYRHSDTLDSFSENYDDSLEEDYEFDLGDLETEEGEKERVYYLHQKKELVLAETTVVDYFIFFRRFGMRTQMLYLLEIVKKIRSLRVILFLFMKCLRYYESSEVKEIFRKKDPGDLLSDLESSILATEKKKKERREKRKKPKKKKGEDYDYDTTDDDEEEEEEEEDMAKKMVPFSLSISELLFVIMKMRKDEILGSSKLLGFYGTVLNVIGQYHNDLLHFRKHRDFSSHRSIQDVQFATFIKIRDSDEELERKKLLKPLGSKKNGKKKKKRKKEDEKEISIEERLLKKKDDIISYNCVLKTKDGGRFLCHREMLILRTNMFFRIISFPGKESIELTKRGEMSLEYLTALECEAFLEFIYTGGLESFIGGKRDDEKRYFPLFSLLKHCEMYGEVDLTRCIFKTLYSNWKPLKKQKVRQLITEYVFLLESENMIRRFVEVVLQMEFADSESLENEEDVFRIIEKSQIKYKSQRRINELTKQNIKMKKELQNVKSELEKWKNKYRELETRTGGTSSHNFK